MSCSPGRGEQLSREGQGVVGRRHGGGDRGGERTEGKGCIQTGGEGEATGVQEGRQEGRQTDREADRQVEMQTVK